MAAVKKTKPLSIDELLDAQRAQLANSQGLSESQIKYAKEQVQKLEDIKTAMLVQNIEELKSDYDIKAITRPKGDAKHVTLGDVREQLKTLDKTIKQNLVNSDGEPVRPDRSPLPKFDVIPGGRSDDTNADDSSTESEFSKAGDQERVDRLRKIGSVIDKKTAVQRAGSRNEQLNTRNAAAYERFVSESKDREKLLHDATEEQRKIYSQLEDVMIKLREAGSEDSEKLRQEIAKLSGNIEESPDNDAKKYMKPMMENVQRTASTGNRGNEGTLGDAWSALTGKKTVLKEGFSFDNRGTGSQIRNDETKKFASAKDAGMSRLKGAGSILGNWVLEKNEKNIEGMRHEGFQKFLDNFRPSTTDTGAKSGAPETGTRLENISKLQGQQDELMRQRDDFNGDATVERKRPNLSVIPGGKADAKPGKLQADTINVTGNVVNIKGGQFKGGGAEPSARPRRETPALKAVPTTPAPAATPAAAPAATPAAAPAAGAGLFGMFSGRTAEANKAVEGQQAQAQAQAGQPGGGSILSDVADVAGTAWDLGKSGVSKAGSMASGAWNAGKGLLGKVPGGVVGGAGAALGGMALSYGGDKLKEAGWEKTGSAMDVAGQAASWGGTGAMIGSVIPGVGTAIGAGVGALAGGAYGLYKNWGGLFGGGKKGDAAAGEMDPGRVGKYQGYDPDAPNYDADLAQHVEDMKGMEARAAGGPVVEGKSYLVGERGPEIMTPQKSGKITPNSQLKDLQGDDLKDFQKYSQARAQIESIESMGGGNNTFADVDPELKIKRDKMMRDNYEYGEKLKARGIDVDAHYNRPEGAAEPKMGEAGYVSLADRYNSKVSGAGERDHAGTLNNLSAENAEGKRGAGAAPVIINNNTTTGGGKSDQPMVKGSARNEESSLSRYTNRTASFF